MQRNKEKQKYDDESLSESAYMCKLLMWLINKKI